MLIVAILVLLVLFVLIALPGLAAITHPRGSYVAVPLYLMLAIGISLHYFGLSFGGRVPLVAAPGGDAPALCEQAIRQAERGGLIVDRSQPNRVTVSRGLWNELPEQIRDGIVLCLSMGRPANQREMPVQVIQTGGGAADNGR